MTTRDPRPRSQQIAADLRAAIMSGDLIAGDRLPSTAELGNRYGVPGATIQNALSILKSEGYLEGRTGVGVFVRGTPQQTITPADYVTHTGADAPYAWIVEASRRGEQGGSQLLDVGEVPAPAEVAYAFGIGRGAPVVRRYQLLTLDDEPVELVSTYYPVGLARGTALAERRKIRGGAAAVLAELAQQPSRFEDVVSARPATTEEFVRLELPTEVPVLRTFRVVVAATGEPLECQVMVKAGNRRNVRYRWPT
jgi:GntR family transcriptional regulator